LTDVKTRRIAIANQKGGVGKTTTAINLGASLAAAGRPTLIVDVDPQGNAGSGLGVYSGEGEKTLKDVLNGLCSMTEALRPTAVEGLYLVPSSPEMVSLERDLLGSQDAPLRLRRAVESLEGFAYMLFDCPPSLGLLTLNAMLAADGVLIPVQAEYYALEGLTQLLRAVEYVRGRLGHPLEIDGVLLTMYDSRTRLADDVEKQVRKHFGRRVYQTVIPRNVRLSEAPSHGMPVLEYALTSRGAQSYLAVAREMLAAAAV